MTDASLMEAECIHNNLWFECDECFADFPGDVDEAEALPWIELI